MGGERLFYSQVWVNKSCKAFKGVKGGNRGIYLYFSCLRRTRMMKIVFQENSWVLLGVLRISTCIFRFWFP